MADWIIAYISGQGYAAVFVLMIAENIFPPIPSEIVLPFIGHAVAQGEMNFALALLFATMGSLIGTSAWFSLGWFMPAEKLERFFRHYGGYVAISTRDFNRATKFFTKYEIPAVFFGRMIPAVRSVISIPAGSVRMDIRKFFFYTLVGTALWNATLMIIGFYVLSDFTLVEKYMSPVSNAIIYTFIAVYLLQVGRFVWQKHVNKTHPK